MTTVDSAPPAAPLPLLNSNPALFTKRDQKGIPCVVTLPGSSNLALTLFNVTATGVADAASPGTVVITLYGRPNLDSLTTDPNEWLPLCSTPPEPIGGDTDLSEAMFMLQASDLMANPTTGKIQGTFKSNVASTPVAPQDLEHHPPDVTDVDPLYVFAVGASFTPTGGTRTASGDDPQPICTLTLASLTLSA